VWWQDAIDAQLGPVPPHNVFLALAAASYLALVEVVKAWLIGRHIV
jgi:hypothetical protein